MLLVANRSLNPIPKDPSENNNEIRTGEQLLPRKEGDTDTSKPLVLLCSDLMITQKEHEIDRKSGNMLMRPPVPNLL